MFSKLIISSIFILISISLFGQLNINSVSNSDLKIWSKDQLYIYEFYIENKGEDTKLDLEIETNSKNSSIHIGLGNQLIDDLKFQDSLCTGEKILVRVFFKNLPHSNNKDSICIRIHQDTITYNSHFTYQLVEEEDKLIKLFQADFTKYLILDIDYGSIKEVILYSPDRSRYEHIKSRSRLLDLSFLDKGKYIIEINNEEYIINKM